MGLVGMKDEIMNGKSLKSKVHSLKSDASAFTLVELLLVITVIAILAALLFPAISKVREGARERQAGLERRIIEQAIGAYIAQERRFPAPDNHLGNSATGAAGSNMKYGEDEDGGDNRVVMDVLRDAAPPVLDVSRFRWDDAGNVLNPWGAQYRIELDLSYSSQGRGYRVGVNKPDD